MAKRKNTEDVTINDRKNQAHSGIPCCVSALEKKKEGQGTAPQMQTILVCEETDVHLYDTSQFSS